MRGWMKTCNRICAIVIALLALVFTVGATTSTLGFTIESVNIDAFPLIEVRLSAWDSSGEAIKDLRPSNFQIVEDHGSPLQPGSVSIDDDVPLAVALVLDMSGSMQGQALEDAKVAAARFLDRLGPEDQAALVAFSTGVDPNPSNLKAEREYPFTHELKVIYDAVEGLEAEGGTELYNALQKAIAMAAQLPEGHRAVLLLSDGMNDPADAGNPDIPLQMAQKMNVPVYVIGLGYNYDKVYLDRLAAESGGIVRIAPRSSELAQTFDDIADLLKTQYVLLYESSLTEAGPEAQIEITLTNAGASAVKLIQVPGLDKKISSFMVQQTQEAAPTPRSEPTAEVVVTEPTIQPITSLEEEVSFVKDYQLLQLLKQPWLWLGAAAGLIVLIYSLTNRKRKQAVYHCARCGYKLPEGVNTCPECGETRKI